MVKRFCDICGRAIDEQLEVARSSDPGVMIIHIERRQREWDICPSCKKKIEDAITNMTVKSIKDTLKGDKE